MGHYLGDLFPDGKIPDSAYSKGEFLSEAGQKYAEMMWKSWVKKAKKAKKKEKDEKDKQS